MTTFEGDEVAAVLAAALLSLDDDAQLDVVVHLPDGTQSRIDRVWYEPNNERLIIETERTAPRLRPTRNWSVDPLGVYDPRNPEWVFLADGRVRGRRRAQPLRDVTADDVSNPDEPQRRRRRR